MAPTLNDCPPAPRSALPRASRAHRCRRQRGGCCVAPCAGWGARKPAELLRETSPPFSIGFSINHLAIGDPLMEPPYLNIVLV